MPSSRNQLIEMEIREPPQPLFHQCKVEREREYLESLQTSTIGPQAWLEGLSSDRPESPLKEADIPMPALPVDYSSTEADESLASGSTNYSQYLLGGDPFLSSAASPVQKSHSCPANVDRPATDDKRLVDPLADHSDYCRGGVISAARLRPPASSPPDFLQDELRGLGSAPMFSIMDLSDEQDLYYSVYPLDCVCAYYSSEGRGCGQRFGVCLCQCSDCRGCQATMRHRVQSEPVSVDRTAVSHPKVPQSPSPRPTSQQTVPQPGPRIASNSMPPPQPGPRITSNSMPPPPNVLKSSSHPNVQHSSTGCKRKQPCLVDPSAKAAKVPRTVPGPSNCPTAPRAHSVSRGSSVSKGLHMQAVKPSEAPAGKHGKGKGKLLKCTLDMERKREKNRLKALKEKERRDKSKKRLDEVKAWLFGLAPSVMGPKASQQKTINTLLESMFGAQGVCRKHRERLQNLARLVEAKKLLRSHMLLELKRGLRDL